jgi:hypothetical protein
VSDSQLLTSRVEIEIRIQPQLDTWKETPYQWQREKGTWGLFASNPFFGRHTINIKKNGVRNRLHTPHDPIHKYTSPAHTTLFEGREAPFQGSSNPL